MSGLFDFVLALLPQNMQNQLAAMSKSEWLASTLAIPIPIIIMVVTFLSIRRRLARRRETVVAGTATLAAHAIDDVRARLMRARGQGVLQWVGWWLRWWAGRFAGIWKMGTTITMV
jgi:uncharacterized membrane protein